jgi:hypothetical protein
MYEKMQSEIQRDMMEMDNKMRCLEMARGYSENIEDLVKNSKILLEFLKS